MESKTHYNAPKFDVYLIYIRENHLGAKLYVDLSKQLIVKIKIALIGLKLFVMVILQGENYFSAKGDIFLFMPFYKYMTPQGLVFPRWVHIEPPQEISDPSGVHQERKA